MERDLNVPQMATKQIGTPFVSTGTAIAANVAFISATAFFCGQAYNNFYKEGYGMDEFVGDALMCSGLLAIEALAVHNAYHFFVDGI